MNKSRFLTFVLALSLSGAVLAQNVPAVPGASTSGVAGASTSAGAGVAGAGASAAGSAAAASAAVGGFAAAAVASAAVVVGFAAVFANTNDNAASPTSTTTSTR